MKELTKICSNCGESIPGDAFKCPYCGAVNPKGEKGKELNVIHESIWQGLLEELYSWSLTSLIVCASLFVMNLIFLLITPTPGAFVAMILSIIVFFVFIYIRIIH